LEELSEDIKIFTIKEYGDKINFITFKHKIKEYYKPLGFTNIVSDKEKSLMLKSYTETDSYIQLSIINNYDIALKSFNAPKFDGLIQNYTSNHILLLKQQLNLLLDLNDEEGIVISFQGNWGIGKTFFWDQYIKNKCDGTNFVNISLFGVNSLVDIKKQIVLKIYDSNKISNFLDSNPIIGKVIESKFGIDASLIASNFKKDDFKNIIICFDDFERISSNLSISEILGFISELKEQHNCKIVLINNNYMLKDQDELNHKKHMRKNKEGKIIEKYFTTQTNNQEIFDRYTEKIIDVTLKYEPHLKDTIGFLKERNISKTYVNWELIEKLFSSINDDNKKLNIRLMKQLLIKLELLEDVLVLDDIDKRIKDGILVELFKKIIKQKVDLLYLDVEIRISNTLKEILGSIINNHSVDIVFFKDELTIFNNNLSQQENEEKLSQQIKAKYFEYLYNLEYKDNIFVKDFYELLNTSDIDIVKLVGLSSFEFYIETFLKKLDSSNKDIYSELFITKSKFFIERNIDSLDNLDMFTKEGVDRVLNDYKELEEHYKKLKSENKSRTANSKNEIIETINNILSDRGYNRHKEELLAAIDLQNHQEWMINDRTYFELIFNFIDWINAFSGDKPFATFYENTMMIYLKLSEENKYKYKMEFIIERFPLPSKLVYKMFLKMPRVKRQKELRETAIEWASNNKKIYNETVYSPINEFESGFSYYLTNEKPNIYFKSLEIAMQKYFSDSRSSGINFFKNLD